MIRKDSSLLHIGKNKQLFFDNKVIEMVQDIKRTYHTPKAEPEPLMKADRPWEGVTYFAICTYSILKDSSNKWHCWYGIWDFDPVLLAETRDWNDEKVSLIRLCYAKSEDGIHWEKPELGIYKHKGMNTNIIIGDESFGTFYIVTPIEDINDPDPGKHFKTLGVRCKRGHYGICAAYSPDGISWEFYDQKPSFGTWGSNLDDMMVLTYDPFGKIYVANIRSPYQYAAPLTANSSSNDSFFSPSEPGAWWRGNKRRIFQSESSDFISWTHPYPIFEPDEYDNLDESYYGMCQTQIGDTHIAFVNLLKECDNKMSVRLAYSYDRKNWEWANNRQPWLESSKMSGREWDSIMIYLGVPPIRVGDEYWFYYGGAKNHHDWWLSGYLERIDHPEAKDISNVGYHLGLAKMRVDGFVSLDTSPYREAIVITRPIFPEGNRLVVNARVENGGFIDAEITDKYGIVIPGFSRSDCDRFTGDSIEHMFTWKGKPDVNFGGYCKINFYMRKASLYSFEAVES